MSSPRSRKHDFRANDLVAINIATCLSGMPDGMRTKHSVSLSSREGVSVHWDACDDSPPLLRRGDSHFHHWRFLA